MGSRKIFLGLTCCLSKKTKIILNKTVQTNETKRRTPLYNTVKTKPEEEAVSCTIKVTGNSFAMSQI